LCVCADSAPGRNPNRKMATVFRGGIDPAKDSFFPFPPQQSPFCLRLFIARTHTHLGTHCVTICVGVPLHSLPPNSFPSFSSSFLIFRSQGALAPSTIQLIPLLLLGREIGLGMCIASLWQPFLPPPFF
jgi:hypothetical protein